MPLDPEIRCYLDAQSVLALPQVWEQPIREVRRVVSDRAAAMPRAPVGSSHDVSVPGPAGDLRLRVYQPLPAQPDRGLVVVFHGGGFILGDVDTHDSACCRLCRGAGVTVVSVEYRLAPEHRFPAAAEDAIRAAEWAMAHAAELGADPAKVVLMGDSAGGNLAAVAANATTVATKTTAVASNAAANATTVATVASNAAANATATASRKAAPPLAGQVLVYPVTDLRDVPGYASRSTAAEGYGLTRRAMEWFSECYAPEAWQREDPRASPILASDLRGAPPALVLTVEYDPLTSEGLAYADSLAAAGVPVERHCLPGAIHGSFTNGENWSAGKELWDLTFAWLAARFAAGPTSDRQVSSRHAFE